MAGKLSTETARGRGRVVAAVFLGQETGDRLLQRGVRCIGVRCSSQGWDSMRQGLNTEGTVSAVNDDESWLLDSWLEGGQSVEI
jgi:hypothetical protein